jgi:exodeoxyribonuclease VII large subunit
LSAHFVVIVRGGGGQTDLHCFDSYEIGKAIALLPLPVVSGIGHHRDVTVVDEVSNMREKTPTAVADMIIMRAKDFEDRVDSAAYNLIYASRRMVSDKREALSSLSKNLEVAAGNELLDNFHRLDLFVKGLKYSLKLINNDKQALKARESNINHLTPQNVLKRGYSITLADGKTVKSVYDVKAGDSLKTILYKGELTSIIKSKKKTGNL